MSERSIALTADATRRDVLLAGGAAIAAIALPKATLAATSSISPENRSQTMPFIKTTDGTEIFYKDWGSKDAQPIEIGRASCRERVL